MHMNAVQPRMKTVASLGGAPPRSTAPSLDLGRPQRAMYELLEAHAFSGAVLDIGCGSGEHALMLAAHGLVAVGVDDAPAAIARAQKKARERGLRVDFVLGDLARLDGNGELLRLAGPRRAFDCALDAGTIHRFAPAERAAYARSLHAALVPGGRLFVLCFGEHERGHGGPARITQAELGATFADGFVIERIADARFESLIFPGGANAWLATIRRT